MTDPLKFAALVLVFLLAFTAGLYSIRRVDDYRLRSPAFVALVASWVALSVTLRAALSLHMVDVAAAWVVALTAWLLGWAVYLLLRARHVRGAG